MIISYSPSEARWRQQLYRLAEEHPKPSHPWLEQICEAQKQFDLDFGLDGNVMVKTWGLANSSLGSWVTACFSIHPSDMLEYVTPGNEQSTVVFSLQEMAIENIMCDVYTDPNAQKGISVWPSNTINHLFI